MDADTFKTLAGLLQVVAAVLSVPVLASVLTFVGRVVSPKARLVRDLDILSKLPESDQKKLFEGDVEEQLRRINNRAKRQARRRLSRDASEVLWSIGFVLMLITGIIGIAYVGLIIVARIGDNWDASVLAWVNGVGIGAAVVAGALATLFREQLIISGSSR